MSLDERPDRRGSRLLGPESAVVGVSGHLGPFEHFGRKPTGTGSVIRCLRRRPGPWGTWFSGLP